jgi:hypothetical protein
LWIAENRPQAAGRSSSKLRDLYAVAALPAAASAKPREGLGHRVTKLNGKAVFAEVFVKVATGETARQATGAAPAAQSVELANGPARA